jgi:hypothetical protein
MKWQTIKTVLWSAIGGAMVWWIVLATALGWMPPGRAEKQASERAQAAMLNALTPICVANFEHDADWQAKLTALKKASSWRRDDFVIEQGWATMPGAEEAARGVAQECVNRILASTS